MTTLTFDLPKTASFRESELRISLATKLFERKKLTLTEAARLAEMSEEAFLEWMAQEDEMQENLTQAQYERLDHLKKIVCQPEHQVSDNDVWAGTRLKQR